jgi:hypothetical protein
VSGTLRVAQEVDVTGACNAPPAPRRLRPDRPIGPQNRADSVTWRIDDAVAAPGDSIALQFIMHADGGGIEGYWRDAGAPRRATPGPIDA